MGLKILKFSRLDENLLFALAYLYYARLSIVKASFRFIGSESLTVLSMLEVYLKPLFKTKMQIEYIHNLVYVLDS
jgi:hypothetical protein